jgi:hypothetical protein
MHPRAIETIARMHPRAIDESHRSHEQVAARPFQYGFQC